MGVDDLVRPRESGCVGSLRHGAHRLPVVQAELDPLGGEEIAEQVEEGQPIAWQPLLDKGDCSIGTHAVNLQKFVIIDSGPVRFRLLACHGEGGAGSAGHSASQARAEGRESGGEAATAEARAR